MEIGEREKKRERERAGRRREGERGGGGREGGDGERELFGHLWNI